MHTSNMFSHKRKGVSTILGTLIFIGIIFSSVIPMTLIMRQADGVYERELHEVKTKDELKNEETLMLFAYSKTDDSDITVFVQNLGEEVVEVVGVWYNDDRTSVSENIASSEAVSFDPISIPGVEDDPLNVKVTTSNGNIFECALGTVWYGSNGWYTPSLGVCVTIINDSGQYHINVTETDDDYTLFGEYVSQGTVHDDITKTFLVPDGEIWFNVMVEKRVDLHIHSVASDGQNTAQEIVQMALDRGLAAIAITDHDSVAAIDPAIRAAFEKGLEIIPGMELGVDHEGVDVHLLGYLIDYQAPALLRELRRFQRIRYQRGEKIVDKLNRLGLDLQMETVMAVAGEAPVGRPHVADAMVREEYVDSYREAFARYLGYHAPAYVPRSGSSAREAIELIHSAGGVAVLAHPGSMDRDDLIPYLVDLGLDGLEAFHYRHNKEAAKHYVLLAHHHGLLFTGGSDCHGNRFGQGAIMGRVRVPYHCVTALKKRKDWLRLRLSSSSKEDTA